MNSLAVIPSEAKRSRGCNAADGLWPVRPAEIFSAGGGPAGYKLAGHTD